MKILSKSTLQAAAQRIFQRFGFSLLRNTSYQKLQKLQTPARNFLLADKFDGFLNQFFEASKLSTSQLSQDLVALAINNFKLKGFFVEFGAADGVELSNTLLLERHFQWEGILVEPVARQYALCVANRSSLVIHGAITGESGEIVRIKDRGLFSGIVRNVKTPFSRALSATTFAETHIGISLDHALKNVSENRCIDYLSIDTEGNEFEILKGYTFAHCIHFITVEHNFGKTRMPLAQLLKKNKFTEVFTEFSEFDSWWQAPCRKEL